MTFLVELVSDLLVAALPGYDPDVESPEGLLHDGEGGQLLGEEHGACGEEHHRRARGKGQPGGQVSRQGASCPKEDRRK